MYRVTTFQCSRFFVFAPIAFYFQKTLTSFIGVRVSYSSTNLRATVFASIRLLVAAVGGVASDGAPARPHSAPARRFYSFAEEEM